MNYLSFLLENKINAEKYFIDDVDNHLYEKMSIKKWLATLAVGFGLTIPTFGGDFIDTLIDMNWPQNSIERIEKGKPANMLEIALIKNEASSCAIKVDDNTNNVLVGFVEPLFGATLNEDVILNCFSTNRGSQAYKLLKSLIGKKLNYNLAQIENQIICDDAITEDGNVIHMFRTRNGGPLNGNQWSRIVGDVVKYFDANGEYNVLYNNQFFALIPSVTQLQANIQL